MTFRFIGKTQSPLINAAIHKHPTWELIYNARGNGTMQINGQTYPFFAGSIILCPPESLHYKQAQAPFEDYYITFTADELQRQVYCLEDMNDGEILHVLQAIYSAYHKKLPKQVAQDLFQGLMGMLDVRQTDTARDPYVQQLQQIIVSGFTDPDFNLKTACRQIPQNIDHLRRNFKRQMGVTPHEYLTQLRIRNAKHILAESPDVRTPISEVAFRSGFSDALYFSKVFHAYTGSTPSEWRENP